MKLALHLIISPRQCPSTLGHAPFGIVAQRGDQLGRAAGGLGHARAALVVGSMDGERSQRATAIPRGPCMQRRRDPL